jgi:hypothetical protein
MMKLFAFRDRRADRDKEFGRYHALDIYSILATTSEMEWNRALTLREAHRTAHSVIEAAGIVARYFSSLSGEGMLRMRESPYCRPELQLAEFCNALRELFPPQSPTEGG